MPNRSIISMKRYLYALTAVVAIALIAMFGLTLFSDIQRAVAEEKARMRTLVTIIAAHTSNLLEQNREAMERISRRPAIRAMDSLHCDPILGEFHELFPQFANLATVDMQGMAPCSGVRQPGDKPVSVAATEWFQRFRDEPNFMVGHPFIGPITGKLVAVLAYPVRDADGSLRGLLGLPLDLERFDPRLPLAELPLGTRFGLQAQDGTLVWRNVDPDGLIGKSIGHLPGPRKTLELRDGEFESVGTDGVRRYYAVASIASVGWVAYVGVTTESIYTNVLASARRNALIGLVGMLLMGLLLMMLIRRIELAETDLIHARDAAEAANRAKSTFLSNMSHELRTPLNAILGFAELMERSSDIPSAQRRNLRTINRSGRHLLSLINDILEISRIEAGRLVVHPAACDLHELVEVVVESMELRAQNDGLLLNLRLDPTLPRFVQVDVGKLRQLLINLLSNAIKYTPHGSVELSVSSEGEGEQRTLVCRVDDTGVGISPGDIERIFQPFFQTEQGVRVGEGTGLGLAIARQYATLLGGELRVKSVVGQGSSFTLRLPVVLDDSAQAVPAPRQVLGLAPGQPVSHILIVEDKEDNQRLLSQLMEAAGFSVAVAANGVEAIEAFTRRRPDFIWMDMRMPVMDGYTATRRIRALPGGESLPIVALTASAFEEDRLAIIEAGCNDMVRKPIEADHLFDILSRRLAVDFNYAEVPSHGDLEDDELSEGDSLLDLDSLPQHNRERLQSAAAELDIEAVRAIANELEAEYPAVSRAIHRLANDYRLEALLEPSRQEDDA